MPFTHVFYSVGKIIGPLLCEAEAVIFDVAFIYYGLLVMGGVVMFITMPFGKYFNLEDQSKIEPVNTPILEQSD